MNYLEKKTVLITGGTSGLGLSMAIKLSFMANKVIATGRDKKLLSKLSTMYKSIEFVSLELTDVESRASIINRMSNEGDFVFVDNAAIWLEGYVGDARDEDIESVIAVNLTTHLQLVNKVVAVLKTRSRGHILFIDSVAGLDQTAGYAFYGASKFGIRGFALALKHELKDHNIKVSAIYPGGMTTDLFKKAGVSADHEVWMMNHEDVADIAITMINQPDNVIVDELVVRNFPHNIG